MPGAVIAPGTTVSGTVRETGEIAVVDCGVDVLVRGDTLPGVSDGGAHTKFFTGGAYSTDFLTWLVRDEGVITLEDAH